MQNHQDMNLVLSTDAKPRLKWTPELHQRFVEAVNHLGGADKATPKSLMRVMGITGLTLYHLKSHLQKFRLGKSQQSDTNAQLQMEEMQRKDGHLNGENSDGSQNHNMNDMKISEALEMQLEVQKRLQEQIEVQRHLQLRIEAQGKYLQRVLRKAQETISGYGCCSEALEEAKAELSQLASMVSSGCQSSSLSELTDSTELNFKAIERDEIRGRRMCSIESSLTSSQSSEEAPTPKKRKGKEKEKQQNSSFSEGDCKRLTMQKSDEKHQEFKIVDLNDAQFDDSEIGTPSQLIEYL